MRPHQIWTEIRKGENIELYLVIFASILLIGFNIFGGIQPEWILSLNITILALIAVSLLGNRHRLERIQQQVNQSPQTVFRRKYPDYVEERLAKAKELVVVGTSLIRTTNGYFDTFSESIQNGNHIKFLIVDSNGIACDLATYRMTTNIDVNWHRKTILHSIGLMCRLKEKSPSNVEIRTINYVPSFGLYGVDIDTQSGIFFTEHYGFKLKVGDKPKIVLRPEDGEWYQIFKTQIKVLWEHGIEWQYGVEETDNMLMWR
ncbi:MAG: hypothetical protein AAF639_26700 [Chloroflexota bacterium]